MVDKAADALINYGALGIMALAGLVGRYVCDSIFLDGMEVCGVNPVLRNAMYVGVRFGGRSVWAAHERSDVAYYRQLVRFENNNEKDR